MGDVARSDLMMVSEAARELRVSRQTVDKWIESGYLDAVKLGPDAIVRVRRASVEGRQAEMGLTPLSAEASA